MIDNPPLPMMDRPRPSPGHPAEAAAAQTPPTSPVPPNGSHPHPQAAAQAALAMNGRPMFRPPAVNSFMEAGLNPNQIEALVLKFLLNVGMATGRLIAEELGLPFGPFPDFLRSLKNAQILNYANAATANDYFYSLTDVGRQRARMHMEECQYVGTAPVPFEVYLDAVRRQTIAGEQPQRHDLERAFSDLLIDPATLDGLGPAICSGRGMFLYGAPGNGKTSIAERITKCFGTTVWIPRVILVEGLILKLFDESNHEEITKPGNDLLRQVDHDLRWVEIRRPTIVAGGELTMDNLEIYYDPVTKISEAPLQMKANNGTFLIDDFGRQRMEPQELLNRWIVPLEKRYDFLKLANGKKIQVPFDQLILFSTNLEPKNLVDEAFLRRIPYKIQASDPTEAMFRQMFSIFAKKYGFPEVNPKALDHLVEVYYKKVDRPFRCCQPRDLLAQVANYCRYNGLPLVMKPEYFDVAAANYFTVM